VVVVMEEAAPEAVATAVEWRVGLTEERTVGSAAAARAAAATGAVALEAAVRAVAARCRCT